MKPPAPETCTCRTRRKSAQVPLAPCLWHLNYRRAVRARKRMQRQTWKEIS